YWYYDRHRSVRLVILVGLAIDQIAQSGLSSLSVIYYSAQLFRHRSKTPKTASLAPVLIFAKGTITAQADVANPAMKNMHRVATFSFILVLALRSL
ncbi:hypothetical protein, partial [Citrobacter portucalensis]|uniref:hypothetical protein n=1 Tax=Citrobacter portucalensis TaxID=1639133 RepID=UPI003D6E5B2F